MPRNRRKRVHPEPEREVFLGDLLPISDEVNRLPISEMEGDAHVKKEEDIHDPEENTKNRVVVWFPGQYHQREQAVYHCDE